jgi:hypothetical protein
MIKPWMRHLQGLVAVDQMPGSNITDILNKHNLKSNIGEGENIMMLKEYHEDFKNSMHTRRIYAMRFSKTYFSLRICASYQGKLISHHNRHQDKRK